MKRFERASLWTMICVTLLFAFPAFGDECFLPESNCAGALHCGGDWDFENGFVQKLHYLAGLNGSSCGLLPSCNPSLCNGHNVSCVESDRPAYIGTGWEHWASFPTWPLDDFYGFANFNENKNCANVHKGDFSQEITLTCADGIGLIYKTASVPLGHTIKVEAHMKFTPNGAGYPDTLQDLGLDPTGGTDPTAPSVQWFPWDQNTPSPPQAGSVFNRTEEQVLALANQITVFIRLTALQPPCQGQTFLIDNVKVFDLGAPGPVLGVNPTTLNSTTPINLDPPNQTFAVTNTGATTMAYSISESVDWLSVSPTSGSSTGESDTITVDYDVSSLSNGTYQTAITVNAGAATGSPQQVNVTLTIAHKPADFDNDNDVDLADFGKFQACYSGVGSPAASGCEDADLDNDQDVDADDFTRFRGCMSGNNIPSDVNCLP